MLTEAHADRPWLTQVVMRHRQVLGLLPALLIASLAFHAGSGGLFFTAGNLGVLGHQVAINLVLASGMTFVILTGGIDLSISSILAAAVVGGLYVSKMPALSLFWPLACAALGLGFGLVNGTLVALMRLPPFILTLATMTVFLGMARAVTGDMTVYNIDFPYAGLGSNAVLGVPELAVVAMAVIIVSWFLLKRTVLGLSIYAVGANAAAARLAGVPVVRALLAAYGASGFASGLGAFMLASKLHGANAMQVGQSYTLDAITAVILGGTSFVGGIGSIWGTLIGALLIAVLTNGLILLGWPDTWQAVVKGVVIVGAVTIDRARLKAAAYA